MDIWGLLTTQTNLLWTAIVAAIVSAAVSYLFKRYETRDKLKAEYQHEQRKKIKELIGRYHGRLLQAAVSLNHRLWNLYLNQDKGWLNMEGKYDKAGYYFRSTIYRFLHVCTLIRKFESEAIFLDQRIAEKQDFIFLNYLEVLNWSLTDIALFEALAYDSFYSRDHFFSDALRQYCDSCWTDGDFIPFEALAARIKEDRSLDDVLEFFDGLNRDEDRLRWDRMVVYHLLLVGFINTFGYETQRTSPEQLREIAQQARHPDILNKLVEWLPRHGLHKQASAKEVSKAILEK